MKFKVSGIFALTVVLALGVAFAGEGWVALTTAEPSCPDASGNRYVDCGNGTVTDNSTGLVWLRQTACFTATDWFNAMETASGIADPDCGLTDGSAPGDWHLPSRKEWIDMISAAWALGCVDSALGGPSITNDAGTGCWGDGPSSFTGVQSDSYWSAATLFFSGDQAWSAELDIGLIFSGNLKTASKIIWAVRTAQ